MNWANIILKNLNKFPKFNLIYEIKLRSNFLEDKIYMINLLYL